MFGLMGKLLRVDLSRSKVSEEPVSAGLFRKLLGGRGLATNYLLDEVPKGADPLGPQNKLIFMTGPLTGTYSPSAGRYTVVTKSPLTGIWAHANSGGFWAPAFKATGFDGIIFEGVSPEPVYVVIDEGEVELREAKHLWGKGVSETERWIANELGEQFVTACIGIAGEQLVRYAGIVNNEARLAARCGVGAVMGSKRLKAVAVSGTKQTPIADRDAFTEVSTRNYELLNESLFKIGLEMYGTGSFLDLMNIRGGFPTRNFQSGFFEKFEAINGVAVAERLLTGRKNCYACPIQCGRVTEIRQGPYKGRKGEGPEYETLGVFGGMCGVDDLEAITMAGYLCNDYGLDTISTGNTIGFAMECYEKGILTKSDTEGLELKFGDAELMVELVHKIAKREGVGHLLAEGTRRMSEKLGNGSERFAMHAKGLELPAYDGRAAKLVGLGLAVGSRGGCHMMSTVIAPTFMDMPFLVVKESHIEAILVENPEEVKIVKDMEDAMAIFDCSGACKFMGTSMATEDWIALISAITGWEWSEQEYEQTGERVVNQERVFNVREGITRADDTLPKRLLEEPLVTEGPAKGQVINLPILLDAYYECRGWDKESGKPTPEKLRELGLQELITQIYSGTAD